MTDPSREFVAFVQSAGHCSSPTVPIEDLMKIKRIEVLPISIPLPNEGAMAGAMVDGIGFVFTKVYAGKFVGYGVIGPWHEESTVRRTW